MGGERVICADGERVDGWGAVGDGVCGGAADYGDGEDGAGEGGDWGGMCFFFLLLFFLSFSKLKAFSHSLFFRFGGREGGKLYFFLGLESLVGIWIYGSMGTKSGCFFFWGKRFSNLILLQIVLDWDLNANHGWCANRF